MKYRLTNREAQQLYWSAENDQFSCKQDSPEYAELQKLLAQSPYDNPKFRPTVDLDVLGYWMGKEAIGLAEHHASFEDTGVFTLKCMFDFAAKFAHIVEQTETQFKTLALLCLELDVLHEKIDELADMMDKNHIEAARALKYYTNHVINTLSMQEEK